MLTIDTSNIIIDSRVSPFLNGNRTMMDDYNMKCTSGHKWLFAICVGLLAFIVYNVFTLYIIIRVINKMTGRKKVAIVFFPSLIYSILCTIIFILLLRLILW